MFLVLEQSAGHGAHPSGFDGDLIEVRLPAAATHLPVLRTLSADLAARLDFNLDEVADVRMAVDEACAGLVARAADGATLRVSFTARQGTLRVVATAPTTDGAQPARDTFGWQVLTALVDEVETAADDTSKEVTVELIKHRAGSGA
ncbi:MAG: anti-sigma factor [Actinomycetia bacterium]|nr:anti-sigma factor [Actinomycetes bacterium]MDQ1651723.1 serine/threonine-protein kinase RsbW [Cryptosporangiaceae bacterium]MDQ1655325.1 serine/threonine-protein kinase RsbW [Cryptosporangiaceae bacterium]